MKRFFGNVALAVGITLVFSLNAFAAGGSLKIGYFDLQAAVTQSDTGKKAIEELKKEEENLSSESQQKMRTFSAARDEYDKKKDVMDEKGKNRKEKELGDMLSELQKMRTDSNTKINEQRNTTMSPLIKKAIDIAKKIGRDEKYDFIMEKSVLHYEASEKEDLTKRIADELDKSRP